MTEEHATEVFNVVLRLRHLAAATPAVLADDGHSLYEYAKVLVDASCEIQTTLCRIWREENPCFDPKSPAPKPLVRASLDDILGDIL